MSGFSLCRQLRALDPQHSLSILLISTKKTMVDQNWGLRQGADRYLTKPFTNEQLVEAVQALLHPHSHF
jgi:DNA-binding response OmpR family regulator